MGQKRLLCFSSGFGAKRSFVVPCNNSSTQNPGADGTWRKANVMNGRITLMPRFRVVVVLLTAMVLGGILQGQTLTPADPGPRPVGNNNPFCPPAPGAIQSAKFPTAPPCIDTAQPPDTIGDAGAGNVVGNSNLAGFWFQALAVFEVKAEVGPGPQTGAGTFPGLGPSFNAVSCFQCHSQPTVGGSSPANAEM